MSKERHENISSPNDAQYALNQKFAYQMLFLRRTRDNHKNYDDSRRTSDQKKRKQKGLDKKYGRAREAIVEAISQDLSPESDLLSDKYDYTPPSDSETIKRINQQEADPFKGVRIPRRLPDFLEQHAPLLGENLDGQGPNQLKLISLNPHNLFVSRLIADDYSPESWP